MIEFSLPALTPPAQNNAPGDLVVLAHDVLAAAEPTRRWLLLATETATLTDICATELSRPRTAGGPSSSFA